MKLGLYQALEEKELLPIYDYEAPPLGILYIASYLEKYMDFKDVIVEREDAANLISKGADIIGISALSPYFDKAIKSAEKIKKIKPHIPLIIGGTHITILPHMLPPVFDIGVIGEGEATTKELLELYMEEGVFRPEKLRHINGIVFHGDNGPEFTPPRDLIDNMDLIPFPKKELLEDISPVPCILTSRGCPFKCTFCSPARYWKKFRAFSPSYIKKELQQIMEHIDGIPVVSILDDTFVTQSSRFREIYDFIIENKYNEKVEFNLNIRANIFTEETCKMLKNMNVTKVYFGAESGSDRILKYYKKRQTAEDNQRVVDLCYKYGLEVTTTMILGAPIETKEDMELTYRFVERNVDKIYHCSVEPLLPLPGTVFWDYAIKRGLMSETGDFLRSGMDFIFMCEHVSREELCYYLNKILLLVKNKMKVNINRSYQLLDELQKVGIS